MHRHPPGSSTSALIANRPPEVPPKPLSIPADQRNQHDGVSLTATPKGARLCCVFQRLEGQVTREGLRLTSADPDTATGQVRVTAISVERDQEEPSTSKLQRWTFSPAGDLPNICHSNTPASRSNRSSFFSHPNLLPAHTLVRYRVTHRLWDNPK